MGAPIEGLTDGFVSSGALVRLAHLAIDGLIRYGALPVRQNSAFWQSTGVAWCFPEISLRRFMWPEDEVPRILHSACGQRLAKVVDLPLALVEDGYATSGHVGAAELLSRLDLVVRDHGLERVILLAADSYLDLPALRGLLDDDRLKTSGNPAGLYPGEAGAAVLLEDASKPYSSACGTESRILSTAVRPAPDGFDEEKASESRVALAPEIGRSLADAIGAVLEMSGSGGFCGDVILDLNGEEWKSLAWGHAQIRLQESVNLDRINVVLPCVNFGEIGAASAVAGLCIATRSFVRGYASSDQSLILSMSDGGAASAILVHSV
jgi:3-oxoacyl-[acyl-carrier-protein] synthase-1